MFIINYKTGIILITKLKPLHNLCIYCFNVVDLRLTLLWWYNIKVFSYLRKVFNDIQSVQFPCLKNQLP